MFGRGPDPSAIFVGPAHGELFNTCVQKVSGHVNILFLFLLTNYVLLQLKERTVLTTYRNNSFPHYDKLSLIIRLIRGQREGCGPSAQANVELEVPRKSASTDGLSIVPGPDVTQFPSQLPLGLSVPPTSTSSSAPSISSTLVTPSSLPHHPPIFQPSSSAYPLLPPPSPMFLQTISSAIQEPLACSPQPGPLSFPVHSPMFRFMHSAPPSSHSSGSRAGHDNLLYHGLPQESRPISFMAPPRASPYVFESQQTGDAIQPSAGGLPPQSVPATFLFSSQHPASHTSGSHQIDNATQQSQWEHRLAATQSLPSSRSSVKRRRTDEAPADDGSSLHSCFALEAPSVSSALVGITGAMNHLSTTLHLSTMQTTRAAHVIISTKDLTDNQKAYLYLYFCKNPHEAAPLSEMDPHFRMVLFNTVLEGMKSQ